MTNEFTHIIDEKMLSLSNQGIVKNYNVNSQTLVFVAKIDMKSKDIRILQAALDELRKKEIGLNQLVMKKVKAVGGIFVFDLSTINTFIESEDDDLGF